MKKSEIDKQIPKVLIPMLRDTFPEIVQSEIAYVKENIISTKTFTETKWAIRHKPTQKWVWFGNEEIEITVPSIKLVDFKYCLINSSQGFLIDFLKRSAYNGTSNYGNDNFLEFEFVKVKTTHTIEE